MEKVDQETGEILESEQSRALIITPSSSPAEYIESVQIFAEFMKTALVKGKHYGPIPGVKGVSLKLPGAEIIAKYFAIGSLPTRVSKTEDFAIGFFSYTYEAVGIHIPTQKEVGGLQRTCNSYETKYLYTWKAEKWATPEEKKEADRKRKNKKYGGYDIALRRSPEELAANINTYMAMAQKRAYVAMIRQVTAASEFFQEEATDPPPGKPAGGQPLKARENPGRVSLLRAIFAIAAKLGYDKGAIKERSYKTYQVESMHDLTMDQLRDIKVALQQKQAS